MTPARPPASQTRRPAFLRLLPLPLGVALILILNSCGLAREAMYAPRNGPIAISEWTNSPPREVKVTTQDGLGLQGFYFPGSPQDPDIFIFFHGRKAHQGVGAKYAQYLATEGNAVLAASYRGFGGNPGSPSKEGMLKDAAAFIKEARLLKGPQARLWLIGHSLGGAVALRAANADGHVAGVIALSTFATLDEAAPPLLRGFLPDRWNNLAEVAQLSAPLLILQGEKDDIIPPASGRALFERAEGPAAYISLKNRTHKPYMQELGPWTSKAIAALAGRRADMLPVMPSGWVLAGTRNP